MLLSLASMATSLPPILPLAFLMNLIAYSALLGKAFPVCAWCVPSCISTVSVSVAVIGICSSVAAPPQIVFTIAP